MAANIVADALGTDKDLTFVRNENFSAGRTCDLNLANPSRGPRAGSAEFTIVPASAGKRCKPRVADQASETLEEILRDAARSEIRGFPKPAHC